MNKSEVLSHKQGSAERVVAHAMWQKSRGRKPSMHFILEHNPRKALALAMSVLQRAERARLMDSLSAKILRRRLYLKMSDVFIKAAVRGIIASSSSEEDVRRRVREELDYPHSIELRTHIPEDETGREARELVRGLGGLIMRNGAMAMGSMEGPHGLIFF